MNISYKIVFCICCFLFFCSCSKNKPEWSETAEGVKIFHNYDKGGLSIPSIEWTGDSLFGLAHGNGTFKYINKNDSNDNVVKRVFAHYGCIDPIEDLENYTVGGVDDEGRLKGFGVIVSKDTIAIGNAKKGQIKGDGLILVRDTLYYKGELKKSRPNGEGIAYYPNGTIRYSGHWKYGLYNGAGTLFIDGRKYRHVWEMGALDKTTQKYYGRLQANRSKLNSVQYAALQNRAYVWERYYVWEYILIGICTIIILLIPFGTLLSKIDDEDPYLRPTPWKVVGPYVAWLFGGILGLHRAVLRSYGCLVYMALFAAIVIMEAREMCQFLFWPSTWFLWRPSTISILCLLSIGILMGIDLIWIPWRVYKLNTVYFRVDKYEEAISLGKTTPVQRTYNSLPQIVEKAVKNLPASLSEAKRINNMKYEGNTGFMARVGRAITNNNSALNVEIERLQRIEKVHKDAVSIYNKFADASQDMNKYLAQQRGAAYRNLYLAKELIMKIKPAVGKEQTLIQDTQFDESTIQFIEDPSTYIDTNVGMDWDLATNQALEGFGLLMKCGMKTGWAAGIAVGTAVVSAAVDAVQKEVRAREQANAMCEDVIGRLDTVCTQILSTQSKLLRSGEILEALFNANKAFLQAYIPLRDRIYGTEATINQFVTGVKLPENLINDQDFIRDVIHLKMVCSEYNKINQSKI